MTKTGPVSDNSHPTTRSRASLRRRSFLQWLGWGPRRLLRAPSGSGIHDARADRTDDNPLSRIGGARTGRRSTTISTLRLHLRLGLLAQRHPRLPGARLRPQRDRGPAAAPRTTTRTTPTSTATTPRTTGTRASAPRATPSTGSSTVPTGCATPSSARAGRPGPTRVSPS